MYVLKLGQISLYLEVFWKSWFLSCGMSFLDRGKLKNNNKKKKDEQAGAYLQFQ